jgi:hypothetical protein
VISYRNNTDIPLYCLSVSNNNFGFPNLNGSGIEFVNSYDDLTNIYNFSKNNYSVLIGGLPHYLKSWSIDYDTIIQDSPHEINTINDVISNIYENILKIEISQTETPAVLNFNEIEINENDIISKLSDNFIFLNAGEKYTDSYNLVGFQILGGSYNFGVNCDSLNSFVYTDPVWDKKQEKWIFKKTSLPPKVGDYNLYSGSFYSNNVSVKLTKQ